MHPGQLEMHRNPKGLDLGSSMEDRGVGSGLIGQYDEQQCLPQVRDAQQTVTIAVRYHVPYWQKDVQNCSLGMC